MKKNTIVSVLLSIFVLAVLVAAPKPVALSDFGHVTEAEARGDSSRSDDVSSYDEYRNNICDLKIASITDQEEFKQALEEDPFLLAYWLVECDDLGEWPEFSEECAKSSDEVISYAAYRFSCDEELRAKALSQAAVWVERLGAPGTSEAPVGHVGKEAISPYQTPVTDGGEREIISGTIEEPQ